MSSILKALKKLEDDKAVRRPDELKIDAEILRSNNSSRFSAISILLTSFLLVAAGSGATYLYMKRDKAPEKSLSMQNKPDASTISEIKTEKLLPVVVVAPAHQKDRTKAEALKLNLSPIAAKPTPTPAASKPVRPLATAKPVEPAKTPIVPSYPALPSVSAKDAPALTVNGIAFNDGGTDSVAMINGVPVSNGSMIEGVKIEEIHKNRVKFNYGGEKFEILLGQSNR